MRETDDIGHDGKSERYVPMGLSVTTAGWPAGGLTPARAEQHGLHPFGDGPWPKSHCSHMPGSVTQGRCTRTRPARYAFFTTATARRAVRSEPV